MPAPTPATTTASYTKRKVDDRIRHVIDAAVEHKHRSVFLLIGDKGKDQIVNLHTMVSRAQHSAKVRVLWCMKGDPIFISTSRKRLEKQGRLEVKAGMASEATKETFETFLQQTDIRFCQYKDSHKVLGQTFGMAVLQDFEAMTPNILARTIETVAGGGIIVIMLRAMSSLKQLYTIAMDVHSRFRSESHSAVIPRFNERFILSLCDCKAMMCVDDDLNVLPITNAIKNAAQSKKTHRDQETDRLRIEGRLRHEAELSDLKAKLQGSQDIGPLVSMCQTMDQAKAVLSLMQTAMEKTLKTTCAVTAGRGRGKSAALGLAVAGAVCQGYSNIFVTAPSPENVTTLFEFVVKGLAAMGYVERSDFEVMVSTNPDFAKCVVRVDITKGHRQTVQFIAPQDSAKFAQAELLVIDEAAALPLPLVQAMLGPYLIFISSTISGYEGTGRSLSMKLIADMRKQSAGTGSADGRTLREISLADPIRYGPQDPVEGWLTKLLCLDATESVAAPTAVPHPSKCELFYVNRDALFSYHPMSEGFLHDLVSLFVSAHYKNQPNDLQLMSDAPGHHLFALCAPPAPGSEVPQVLVAVHMCEEGNVAADRVAENLSKGSRPSGDLIPYTVSQQYSEQGFAKLAGIRVVRIATHPELQRAGYGQRALELICEYFSGNIAVEAGAAEAADAADAAAGASNSDDLAVRRSVPRLLRPLEMRPNEVVDYIGVSFGLTVPLFNYWQRSGFHPMYIRQAANDLTAEHSCIMVRTVAPGLDLSVLQKEFQKRFLSLLGFSFRQFSLDLALSVVLEGAPTHTPHKLAALVDAPPPGVTEGCKVCGVPQASWAEVEARFEASDIKRLEMYTTSYVDTSVVLDLVPIVARMYFERKLFRCPDGTDGVVLSHAQAAMLLAMGQQHRHFEEATQSPIFKGVQPQQLRAFFHKAMVRIVEHFKKLRVLATGGAIAEEVEEQELKDAKGNVIGMTVARKKDEVIDTDQTLFRDAKSGGRGRGREGETSNQPARKARRNK